MGRISRSTSGATLSQVLALPSFAAANPEIITGAEHASAPVSWLQAIDSPSSFVEGEPGELVVCERLSWSESHRDSVKSMLDRLHRARVTALVSIASAAEDAPEWVVQYAQRHNVAIVVLHRQLEFGPAIEESHDLILGLHLRAVQRVEAYRNEMFRLARGSHGVDRILDVIAETLATPVVLEASSGKLLAITGPDGQLASAFREWGAHGRMPHAVFSHEIRAGGSCVWGGIRVRDRHWATLHVLGLTSSRLNDGLEVLEAALPALRFAAEMSSDTDRDTQRRSDVLVAELLSGRAPTGEDLRSLFEMHDKSVPTFEVVAFSCAVRGRSEVDSSVAQALLSEVLAGLLSHDEFARSCVLASAQPHSVCGLLPASDHAVELFRAALESAQSRLRARVGENVVLQGGMSAAASFDQITVSLAEAQEALRFGPHVNRLTVTTFDDIELTQLVARVPSDQLEAYVDEEIGAVLEYDARRDAQLLRTLEEYVTCSLNATETAQRLFIERRTFYHRLATLEELLPRGSVDQAVELALVALRALHATKALTTSSPTITTAQTV